MNIIKNIFRYPIKGLSGQKLNHVFLEKNQVLPGDREFAFARHHVEYDENAPIYLKKTNFLALVKEEKLAELETEYDSQSKTIKITYQDKIILDEDLKNKKNILKVETFFQNFLNLPINHKPYLVQGIREKNNKNLIHSFSDVPEKAVSIINLKTIAEFEKKIGKQISSSRFRGNILIDGGNPWEEFDWIGKKINVGECVLEVFKKTQRCAATNVNPQNGLRDINIPNEINTHYGHIDLGIYTKVVKSGNISISDPLTIN